MLKPNIRLEFLRKKNALGYDTKSHKSNPNPNVILFNQNSKNLLKRRLVNYNFKNKYLNLKALESMNLTKTYFNQTYGLNTQYISAQSKTPQTNFLVQQTLQTKFVNNNTSLYDYLITISNPLLLKFKSINLMNSKITPSTFDAITVNERNLNLINSKLITDNNLLPNKSFKKIISKQAFDFFSSYKFYENIIP